MNTQPATSRLLICELEKFVREAVNDYPFPSPEGNWLDCRVFLHGLPDSQDTDTYPFVIVRWLEGEITSQEDAKTVLTDTVILALGVHSPNSQSEAGLLLAELIDCLRRAFWKKRIIASRFELVEPLRCQIVEQQRQQHRFHLATLETVWNYTWPPKAMEEAGQSQLLSGRMTVDSYAAPEVALAWKDAASVSQQAGNGCAAEAWAQSQTGGKYE